ncbi:MAG: hypothetical protein IVW54_15220 [Candidatus Binataceae bacterium]|nr:hypothetical protein [Candidatus Binataceae bacterium]
MRRTVVSKRQKTAFQRQICEPHRVICKFIFLTALHGGGRMLDFPFSQLRTRRLTVSEEAAGFEPDAELLNKRLVLIEDFLRG